MRFKLVHLLLAAIVCAPTLARATAIPIVSITDSNSGSAGLAITSTQYLQASWTQTGNFSNVDISAWLFGDISAGKYLTTSYTAYLTSTSLLTPLQVSSNFPEAAADVLLFSGLNLSAGTYYLTLASTSAYGGGWSDTLENPGTVTTTLAPSTTLGTTKDTLPAGVNAANPPASTFLTQNPSSDELLYSVVSNIPSTVPEPSSLLLMGTASLGFILQLRKRR